MTLVVCVPHLRVVTAGPGCPPTQKLNQGGITIGDHTWTDIATDLVLNGSGFPSNDVLYASAVKGTDEFLVAAWKTATPRRHRVCRYRLNPDRTITRIHQYAVEDWSTTLVARPSTYQHDVLAGSASGKWAYSTSSNRMVFFDGTTAANVSVSSIFTAIAGADPAESMNRLKGVHFMGDLLVIGYTSYDADADHYGYLTFDTSTGTPASSVGTGWTNTRMGTVPYGPDSLYYISDASVVLADEQIIMLMCESDSSTGTTLDTQSRPVWATRAPTAGKGEVKIPGVTHWDSAPGVINYYDGQVWFAATDGYYEGTDAESQGRDYVVSFRVEDDELCAFEVTAGESVSNHFNLVRSSRTTLPEVLLSPYTGTLSQFTHASTQSNYVDANGQALDVNAPSFSPVTDESFPDITHYSFDNVMASAAFFNIDRQLVWVHSQVFSGSGQVNDVPGVLVYDIDWEPSAPITLLPFSDDFNRSDRFLAGDNGWESLGGVMDIRTNQVWGAQAAGDVNFLGFFGAHAVGQARYVPGSPGVITAEIDAVIPYAISRVPIAAVFVGAVGTSVMDEVNYDAGVWFTFFSHNTMYLEHKDSTGTVISQYLDYTGTWPESVPGQVFNYKVDFDPATLTAHAYVDDTLVMTLTGCDGPLGSYVGFLSVPHTQFAGSGESFNAHWVLDNFAASQA